MKTSKLFFLLAAAVLAVTFSSCTTTHESSQVTMSGEMVCAKCKLHLTSTCQNVLQVSENGQTVNYFLAQNQVSTDFHHNICTSDGEQATVTGTVQQQNGQEVLTASKIVAAAQ